MLVLRHQVVLHPAKLLVSTTAQHERLKIHKSRHESRHVQARQTGCCGKQLACVNSMRMSLWRESV